MSRNDNANFGVDGIGGAGNVGIYTESSTAKYQLGHRLELFDGRIFRYCNFDAAVAVGKMVCADQSTGAADEISDGVIATNFHVIKGATQAYAKLAVAQDWRIREVRFYAT